MKSISYFISPLQRSVSFHIGKSQSDNFAVIDSGTPDDLWFHAGGKESSCHVVCSVPADIPPKNLRYLVKTGALLCKQHTQRLKSAQKVEIIYTQLRNIAKTDRPGTVIAQHTKSVVI